MATNPMTKHVLDLNHDVILEDGVRLWILPDDMWGVIHWEYTRDNDGMVLHWESILPMPPDAPMRLSRGEEVEVPHPSLKFKDEGYTKLIFSVVLQDPPSRLRVRLGE